MNLELTRRSLESGDLTRWSAVARDLGRHLAAQMDRSKEWLLPFRRLAAGLESERTSEYHRGFVEALELVATGFERQLDDAAADETELLQLRSQPSWIAVLQHIDQGIERPSDLSDALHVSPSVITRLVDQLEDAQLVTQTTHGRERPCRLTPRARVLLRRLPLPEESAGKNGAAEEPVADVVSAVVTCLSTLIRDRRVGRQRFLESMRGAHLADPERVLALLGAALRETACAVLDSDDAWVATDVELFRRLPLHLRLAHHNKSGTVVDQLAKLSERSQILLRVGKGVPAWDSALDQHARIHVIRDDELTYAPPGLDAEFQIVYESPSLLRADRRQWSEWTKRAIARAIGRYCLGVAHGPAVPDFNLIEVGVPEDRAVETDVAKHGTIEVDVPEYVAVGPVA